MTRVPLVYFSTLSGYTRRYPLSKKPINYKTHFFVQLCCRHDTNGALDAIRLQPTLKVFSGAFPGRGTSHYLKRAQRDFVRHGYFSSFVFRGLSQYGDLQAGQWSGRLADRRCQV